MNKKPAFARLGKADVQNTSAGPKRALNGLIVAALGVLSASGLARSCDDETKWTGDARQQQAFESLHQALDDILPKLPRQPTRQRLTAQAQIIQEILTERARMDEEWGVMDLPSVNSVPYAPPEFPEGWCELYALPTPDVARSWCEGAFASHRGAWASIALAEFSAAVGAANETERRVFLINLNATLLAWTEAIDRRTAGEEIKP